MPCLGPPQKKDTNNLGKNIAWSWEPLLKDS